MRRLVVNAAIKSKMAAYGIGVTELAEHMGRRRSYISYKLGQELTAKWNAKINSAIDEIVRDTE